MQGHKDRSSARYRALTYWLIGAGLSLGFSIDDFGTGYSSLSYLKTLPISQLKIDRSFVADICENTSDAAIVELIISMARHLRLEVIAEGVETKAQLEFLKSQGCHAFQGNYFSAPLPAREIEPLLKRTRAAPAYLDTAGNEPENQPRPSLQGYRMP